MLNLGFGSCSLYVDENKKPLPEIAVEGGVKEELACDYEGAFRYLDTKGAALNQIEKKIKQKDKVKAPVKKGDLGRNCRVLSGWKKNRKCEYPIPGRDEESRIQ